MDIGGSSSSGHSGKFDYIQQRLGQYNKNRPSYDIDADGDDEEEGPTTDDEEDRDIQTTSHREIRDISNQDEHALVLLSSAITSNHHMFEQIKSKLRIRGFKIEEEIARNVEPRRLRSMFKDGFTTFGDHSGVSVQTQFNQLLSTFASGDIVALQVRRRDAYLTLNQLRLELTKKNQMSMMYMTTSNEDYLSKELHFNYSTVNSNVNSMDHSGDQDNIKLNDLLRSTQGMILDDDSDVDDDDDDNNNNNHIDDGNVSDGAYPNALSAEQVVSSPGITQKAIVIFQEMSAAQNQQIQRRIGQMLGEDGVAVEEKAEICIPSHALRDIVKAEDDEHQERHHNAIYESMVDRALEAWLVSGKNVYQRVGSIVHRIDNVWCTTNEESFERTFAHFATEDDHPVSVNSQSISVEEVPPDHDRRPTQRTPPGERESDEESKEEMKEEPTAIIVFKPHMKGPQIDAVESMIFDEEIGILQQKTCVLPSDFWHHCLSIDDGDNDDTVQMAMTLSSDASPIVVYLVSAHSIRQRLRHLIGHQSPQIAKQENPHSVRAQFGIDDTRNCVWWTRSDDSFQKLFDRVFAGAEHESDRSDDERSIDGLDVGVTAADKKGSFDFETIQETLLLIKPDTVEHHEDVERILMEQGFYTQNVMEVRKSKKEWRQFYVALDGNPWFDQFCEWMASDTVMAYCLYRVNAINHLFDLVGPSDPKEAKANAPGSLRARYGINRMRNGFHCCWDEENVQKEKRLLFPLPGVWPQSVPRDRLLVIIKPKAAQVACDRIRAHLAGNGFDILLEREAYFQQQIYKKLELDVGQQHYAQSVMYIATGPIAVLVVEKVNGFGDIADVVGHRDPQIARQVNPESIRAIYGRSAVENAIEVSLNEMEYRQNLDVFFVDDKASGSPSSPEADGPNGHHHLQQFSDTMMMPNGGYDDEHRLSVMQQRNTMLVSQRQHVLLMVKPHINEERKLPTLLRILHEAAFEIVTRNEERTYPAQLFMTAFENEVDANIVEANCEEWSSGAVNVLELKRSDARDPFACLRDIVGPADPEIARSEAPSSIRARLGQDRIRNCCWYSSNVQQYRQKRRLFRNQ